MDYETEHPRQRRKQKKVPVAPPGLPEASKELLEQQARENAKLRRLNKWAQHAAIVMAVTAVLTLIFAFLSGRQEERHRQQLEARVAELEVAVQQREAEIAEQRAQLERGLDAYLRYYLERINAAAEAIDRYDEFNTIENRTELGVNFEEQRTLRFAEARTQLQALVEYVENWRPVLSPLQQIMNGRISGVSNWLLSGNDLAAVEQFRTLRETADSDAARLRQALDGVSVQ